MRTLKKTRKCLNCNQVLSEVYDYCPICGQENNDINVNFWFLLKDFLGNYLSLDSKFFRSIKPFFLNPGFLTLQFMDGKRRSYANPVRLYIIISLIYFFILNVIVGDFSSQLSDVNIGDNKEVIDSLEVVVVAELDSATANEKKKIGLNVESAGINNWPLTSDQWKLFLEIKDNNDLTEEQIVDSLGFEDKSGLRYHISAQIVRVYKKDKEYLAATVVQNLSLMMFLMLPAFAGMLKLLYIRRKSLYINHLIHAIHMHSYAFLIYSIAMALMFWVIESDLLQGWLAFIAFAMVSLNAYLSFKKVYGQHWFKTLVKFWVTGFAYLYLLLFALLLEIFISFLIF